MVSAPTTVLTPRERLLRALASQPVDRPPAWIMRQAGRYLPEYRALREQHDFRACLRSPALAAEITLQPLRRFPLDAAIVFSDILVLLEASGLDVRFDGGDGPRIEPALRDGDTSRLRRVDPERDLAYVAATLQAVRDELGGDRALLGFAGAPYTLACYAVDGGSQDEFRETRILMHRDPRRFDDLLATLAEAAAAHLVMQVRAGADAVQLFDTWAGALGAEDYRARVAPHVRQVVTRVQQAGGRVILFIKDGAHLVEEAIASGADAVAVDWRTDMARAAAAAAGRCALQGNLDPIALFARSEEIRRRVSSVHEAVAGRTGHVFNLGHGILPTTPLSGVEAFLAAVAGLESAR
jgi:uroporphyrinogen decarboxylase